MKRRRLTIPCLLAGLLVALPAAAAPPAAGVEVFGRVIDSQGRPLRSVRVEAFVRGAPGRGDRVRVAWDSSGPEGQFSLRSLAAGTTVELWLRAVGFLDAELEATVPPDEPLVVVLERAAIVTGRVVDESGTDVAGASVFVESERGSHGSTTRDDGSFVFEDVPTGTVRLRAAAEGSWTAEPVTLELASGERRDGVRLVLAPGGAVAGSVTGPDGEPVAGAVVRAAGDRPEGLRPGLSVSGRVVDERGEPVAGAEIFLADHPWYQITAGEPVRTGEDGSFLVTGLTPGIWLPRAEKEGLIQAEPDLRLDLIDSVSGLEVPMMAAAVVTGRIHGLDAGELAKLRVTATRVGAVGPWPTGDVDSEGEFRLEGVGPGAWRVRATLGEDEAMVERLVEIAVGEREARLDLDLSGRLVLGGRVTLGGEPVAGAMVMVTSLEPSRFAHTLTGVDGGFRLARLVPGRHWLTIHGLEPAFRHALEVELDGDHEVRIELAESEVAGRVIDAETGAALGDATVQLVPEGSGSGSRDGARSTEPDGGFLLRRVAPGDYLLHVGKEGYARSRQELTVGPQPVEGVEVALAPAHEVVLEVAGSASLPPHQVAVSVLDPAAADPPADATVVLAAAGGTSKPDERGRVRVGAVPPGRWRVLVTARWRAVSEVEITVPGPPVRVLLAPEATVDFTVRSLTGLGHARLLAANGRPLLVPKFDADAQSSWRIGSGRGRIENVPAGPWTLQVIADDGRTWSRPIVAMEGSVTEVVIDEDAAREP